MRNLTFYAMTGLSIFVTQTNLLGQESETKGASNPAAKAAVVSSPESTANPKNPDEVLIRQSADSYIAAFNKGDAKAVADLYTTDGEYITEHGKMYQGRQAIEDSLQAYFAEHRDRKLIVNIGSIRFVSAGVAIEDGTTTITGGKNSSAVTTRYTAVHVNHSGKWQIASVRDFAAKSTRPHKGKLKQLEWMIGEWVHEDNDATVIFKCEPIENGNFLMRNFTIKIGGVGAVSGSQRIGWDAQANKFRAWIFDSDGGHSDGYWHRDGDSWVLKSTGVTADGHAASSTTIYTYVNPHTMTFQSVDHEIDGVELPDSEKVTIVRHPPKPQ